MNTKQKQQIYLWQTLVLHNCLPLSKPAKFTSKNITQYLLGSRNSVNIFKYDHIRQLLLRIAPLISTLYNSHNKIQNKFGRCTFLVPPTPPRNPKKLNEWKKRMKALNIKGFKKNRYYYKTFEKKKTIKILFATINPVYKKIIKSAATICNMPFHTNRWLCGALTAHSQYLSTNVKKLKGKKQKSTKFGLIQTIQTIFNEKFKSNQEVPDKRYHWHQLQKKRLRPSIVIIPDIQNNDMILRETFGLRIPIIGLINSGCATQITYPIFGNANSLHIVHFFCHFIAVLIAKEIVQQNYRKESHRIYARTRWFLRKQFIKVGKRNKTLFQNKTFYYYKRTSANLVPITDKFKNRALFYKNKKKNKIISSKLRAKNYKFLKKIANELYNQKSQFKRDLAQMRLFLNFMPLQLAKIIKKNLQNWHQLKSVLTISQEELKKIHQLRKDAVWKRTKSTHQLHRLNTQLQKELKIFHVVHDYRIKYQEKIHKFNKKYRKIFKWKSKNNSINSYKNFYAKNFNLYKDNKKKPLNDRKLKQMRKKLKIRIKRRLTNRRRFNIIKGNQTIIDKNFKWLITRRRYYHSKYSDKISAYSYDLTWRLLYLFHNPKIKRKQLLQFLKKYYNLNNIS